ncbi:neurexin-1a-like isoform X2 [Dreissena polymorpha]|uniref:neurexin-1a-like isoform X2 n=1 Tax=Dreissena polymorpha TaxID=45954 RepID=UPI002264B84A|nr:neurexin-1a-like isoform X2 [Dreissena polymorpha]
MNLVWCILPVVFITTTPQTGNGQQFNADTRLTSLTSTSKIIRFYGKSYVQYDFDKLIDEILTPADHETFSMEFITQTADGLIGIWKGTVGRKMHFSLKNGTLFFVIDDGRGSPQQVRIQHPDSRVLSDLKWHKIRVDKNGRQLMFYIDEQLATQVTASTDVQFLTPGFTLYLGGTNNARVDTGLVDTNIDGALVDVEAKKVIRSNKEWIVSFLQFVGDSTGDIDVYDKNQWNTGNWSWGTTRPSPATPTPKQPTPVTFKSGNSMLLVTDPLGMRTGGSMSFRFRTLEPRGLLVMGHGSAVQFFAIEVFDGILYFVTDFGSATSRNMFSDRRVDDGEWHEVTMRVDRNGRTVTLTLDGRQFVDTVSPEELQRMYFFKTFFGGYDNFESAPWPLYSREGFKGCFESLVINGVGIDLHRVINTQRLVGIEFGCSPMSRSCQSQPCAYGFCRDQMNGYVCDCANTPYTGQNCNANAVIAGWDGSNWSAFNFVNREVTHTNDLSVRFYTPLRDTLLFRTEADNNDDYIQAELVDGRAKVTIQVDGIVKTFFTGKNLNDYIWHTLYIRRRADDVQVWVDDEDKMTGVMGGENYKLYIDRIMLGSQGNKGEHRGANNYIGYMQNFIYDDKEIFNLMRSQNTNSNMQWIVEPFDKIPLLTYKPITVTSSETYFQLPSISSKRTLKIIFKFKTRESNGLILYNSGSDAIAVEMSNGHLRLAYTIDGRNHFTVVPTGQLSDNMLHTVHVALNERGQFTVRVDGENVHVSTSGSLSLAGTLYIGGLPQAMFSRPEVASLIESRKGFRGCLASFDLNGAVPDLMNYATDKSKIIDGCTDDMSAFATTGVPVSGDRNGTLKFTLVLTNVGHDYDNETGVFTCRISGLYQFFVSIEKQINVSQAYCRLMVNNSPTILIAARSACIHSDALQQTSNAIVLVLKKGDELYLGYCSDPSSMTKEGVFSGSLLSVN